MDGEYLRVTFEIFQDNKDEDGNVGEFDGTRLYEIFNLFHPTKPKAVGFAKYKFAELVKSTGLDLEKFSNFDELMNKTTRVEVSTEENKEWGDKNKIDRFLLNHGPIGTKSKFDDRVFSTDIPW